MPQKEIIPLYRIYSKLEKKYLPLDKCFITWDWFVSEFYRVLDFISYDNQNDYIVEKCSWLKDDNEQWIFEWDIFGKYWWDIDRPNEFEIWGVVKFDYDLLAFVVNESNWWWVYLDDYKYTNYIIWKIHD